MRTPAMLSSSLLALLLLVLPAMAQEANPAPKSPVLVAWESALYGPDGERAERTRRLPVSK